MTDIGSIIKDHLRQNGSSVNQLAKQLKLSVSQLYYNLNHNHINIERLDEISQALNHNFFIYFVENTGAGEEQLCPIIK